MSEKGILNLLVLKSKVGKHNMEQAQKLEYSEAMQETAIDQTKHNPTGLKLSGKQKTPQKWEEIRERNKQVMILYHFGRMKP